MNTSTDDDTKLCREQGQIKNCRQKIKDNKRNKKNLMKLQAQKKGCMKRERDFP